MNLKIFVTTILLSFCILGLVAQPLTNLSNKIGETQSNFTNEPLADLFNTMPGWVNTVDYPETCFSYMGMNDFSSTWRFKADVVNGDGTRIRQYGFSVPLVGDLDGDGYPEIVSISTANAELHGVFSHLDIYNGQTGVRLAHLRLDMKTTGTPGYVYSSNYHGTPSVMAMANVDPDVNGDVEVIMAFPGSIGYSFPFRNKVVSYRMVKRDVPDAQGNHYDLEKLWESADSYNSEAGNQSAYTPWHRPIPQIVDIDGDGVPEVIVYNKIYNAVTGDLLVKMEDLGSTANVGAISWGPDIRGDRGIGFSYAYDLDLDGKYDIAAGGKVYYDIDVATGSYKIQQLPVVADGRTGVADINGDGIPDVVVVDRTSDRKVIVSVWDPGFLSIDDLGRVVKNAIPNSPRLIAQKELAWDDNATDQGTHSYVYIGDIDGLEQEYNGKTYRLPEIAILSGNLDYGSVQTHPNVLGKGVPTSGWSNVAGASYTGQYGVLAAFTLDPSDSELKLSFVLGHKDRSINTGFTMFDFDNDGVEEICYRDERTLRIIKASTPFVTDQMTNITNPEVILFNEICYSFTGFEYPVIADIDNDASAEMIVIGRSNTNTDQGWGYVYAVGNGTKNKFAPALNVWNQFMYDPFKINTDLTVPSGPAVNRLDPAFHFTKVVRNKETDEIENIIENYNPYNGTLKQTQRYMLFSDVIDGVKYDNLFEPLVFLNEAYFVMPNKTDPSKDPKMVTIGGKHYIEVYVGNKSTAQTDLSINTPITLYMDEVSVQNYYKKVTLNEIGVAEPIRAGGEIQIRIPIDNQYGFYVLRLGDSSDFSIPGSPIWKWGINNPGYNDLDNCIGTASRADRDCNWNDQLIKVAKFALTDDALTLQEYGKLTTNILDNDILPSDFTATFADAIITRKPLAGKLSFTGANLDGNIIYQHTGGANLPDGIDKFTYQLSYIDKTVVPNQTVVLQADVFLYILKNKDAGFTACPGEDFTIRLANRPAGVSFYWYEADGVTEVAGNPQEFITVPAIASDVSYKVKPQIAATNTAYGAINFPKGNLTVRVLPSNNEVLKWTGAVNSAWDNPANWQDDRGEAIYAPTGCVNAIVQKVTSDKHYPVLDVNGATATLTLEDRAMIKNSHLVNSGKVIWQFKLKDSEYNRWLSLSAPITNVYSGDYIVFEGVNQIKNASYMSLFQSADPDEGTSSSENTFTRSFGKVGTSLPLGMPFLLYVDKAKVNQQAVFGLPTEKTTYDYNKNNVQGFADRTSTSENLSRATENKEQFLFTTASDYSSSAGAFTLSYIGEYILVTNPYPAMLDLSKFLVDNNASVEMMYKVWTGNKTDNFVELKSVNGAAPSWVVNSTATMTPVNSATPVYIAPFQSFFVKAISGANSSVQLKFAPSQTDATVVDYEY